MPSSAPPANTLKRAVWGGSPLENWKISIVGAVDHIVLYHNILSCYIYYTIPRSAPPARPRELEVEGAAPLINLQDFRSGSCKLWCIILYYIMLCYTTLYQVRPRPSVRLSRGLPAKLQDFNPRSCKLYFIILYCIVLYYTIPRSTPHARPLEREPETWKTARFRFWELHNVSYYILL